MKKIYTLAAGLLLGACGFGANAATTSETPTINPLDGSTIMSTGDYIIINWGDNIVSFNTESGAYEEFNDDLYGPAIKVDFLVDGEPAYPYWDEDKEYPLSCLAAPIYYMEEYDNWSFYGEGETPYLGVQISWYFSPDSDCALSFTLPEGAVYVGEDTNALVEWEYNYVSLQNEQTTVPALGKSYFSLSEVILTWEGAEITGVNPECDKQILFGLGDYLGIYGEGTPVENVTYNEDGTATISLGVDFAQAGWLDIVIPKGYFELTTPSGVMVPNPDEVVLQYKIEPVKFTPASQATVGGPVSSFGVYGPETITLAGELEDIVVTNGDDLSYTVKSSEATTIEGYPGLLFTLEEPCYAREIVINIPAGTLKVGDNVLESAVSNQFYVKSPESIEPANNSVLDALSLVTLDYGDSTLEINEECTQYPTLTVGNATPINIKDFVKVNEETETTIDPFWGWETEITTYSLLVDFQTEPYMEAGNYTITIPAGYFYIDYQLNGEIVLNYNVVSSGDSYLPAPGYYLENDPMFPTFFIYWDETIQAIDAEATLTASLTVPSDDDDAEPVNVTLHIGTYDPSAVEGQEPNYTDNALLLSINEIYDQFGPGVYNLAVGTIVEDAQGNVNKPFETQFTLLQKAEVTTIVPTVTVDGNNLTVTWDNLALTENNPFDLYIRIFGLTDSTEDFKLSIGNGADIVGGSLLIDLENLDLVVNNEYQLIIPEGFFYIGEDSNVVNGEVLDTFKYEFTGINGINAESLNGKNIYNLNGVKVGNSIENLSNGIYIIDGKKVMIRK